MSKEMVVVFADYPFKERMILGMYKKKPKSLEGLLNLPGGKIEIGETEIEAAERELKEETGLTAINSSSKVMGKIVCDFGTIHCVKTTVENSVLKPIEVNEIPFWSPWESFKDDPTLIINLKLIIPLIIMGVNGWTIVENKSSSSNVSSSFSISME